LIFFDCKSVGFPFKGGSNVSNLVCRQAREVLLIVEKQIRCDKSCDCSGNFSEMRKSHSWSPPPIPSRRPLGVAAGRRMARKRQNDVCQGSQVLISFVRCLLLGVKRTFDREYGHICF